MINFIDLFCGIGGFRIALESIGATCVFSAEVNSHACMMYEKNFGDNPHNDVTKVNPKDLPNFDILCAGFPCQAFSIAGKKLGFEEARGTLFFDICRIVEEKRPKILLLENVKHLKDHDKGNTLKTILKCLKDFGYKVEFKILNAKDFSVPQNRERIIIVASLKNSFDFSKVISQKEVVLEDFLNIEDDFEYLETNSFTLLQEVTKQKSGLIFAGYLNKTIRKGVRENTHHLSRVHRQPNRIYSVLGVHPTLSSQEKAGRYYIKTKDGKVRKLAVEECYRIMGFPEEFCKVGSKNQLYERIGNSVCVPMIKAVAKEIKNQFFGD